MADFWYSVVFGHEKSIGASPELRKNFHDPLSGQWWKHVTCFHFLSKLATHDSSFCRSWPKQQLLWWCVASFFEIFFRKIEIFNKILKHVTCFYDAKHVTCFKILLNISIFLKNFKTTCYIPSQKLLFRPKSTKWAIMCSKFRQKVKTCYMFSKTCYMFLPLHPDRGSWKFFRNSGLAPIDFSCPKTPEYQKSANFEKKIFFRR